MNAGKSGGSRGHPRGAGRIGADRAEEAVGEGAELAHDGDGGHLGMLAALAEAFLEGSEGRVGADRGERGHVDDATLLGGQQILFEGLDLALEEGSQLAQMTQHRRGGRGLGTIRHYPSTRPRSRGPRAAMQLGGRSVGGQT